MRVVKEVQLPGLRKDRTVALEVEAADEDLAPRFQEHDVLVFGVPEDLDDGQFCLVSTDNYGLLFGEVFAIRGGFRVVPANHKYREVAVGGKRVEYILPPCASVSVSA